MSADSALQRAHAYLEDARDPTLDIAARCEALDACRTSLLDARRARASPQLLLPIFSDLCSAAAADPAFNVRCVVPQAVEDLCTREMRTFVEAATPFLVRSLDDDHILVIKCAVRALTSLFRKLIGFVVNVGVAEDAFPESRLSVWLQMQAKAVSFIQHEDEGLRKSAIMLAETVVLAFSYSGGAASPDHFTLDYILKKGTKCPLLDTNALEAEGVRCVKVVSNVIQAGVEGKIETLQQDGRRTSGLPPASFMTAIAVLSNLVRRRRKILQFTLPPLIHVVGAITGTGGSPSTPFRALSESQQRSIVSVLRYSLIATRSYQHARSGRAGADISGASNDLASYEKEQDNRRKERAAKVASQQRNERARAAAAEEARKVASQQPPPHGQPQRPLKRPRAPERPNILVGFPSKEAFVIAQNLIRRMPHKEVVNFIMTRLLCDIPPAEMVPGAARPHPSQRAPPLSNEPAAKKPRKSRFGTKDAEKPGAAVAAPKKVVVSVRKVAPPVVPVRLSADATEKLVTICCRRIMKRHDEAKSSGAAPLRVQLLARLLTSVARKGSQITWSFCDEACDFIANDVENTIDLALAWLHSLFFAQQYTELKASSENRKAVQLHEKEVKSEEAVEEQKPDETKSEKLLVKQENGNAPHAEEPVDSDKEVMMTAEDGETKSEATVKQEEEEELIQDEGDEEDLSPGQAYERILHKLLSLLGEKQDTSNDAFSTVYTEAPVLTPSVIDFLGSICRDPSRIKLGLQTACDIIKERNGSDRDTCLSFLLNFTSDKDEVLRGPAIRLVANKIFVESAAEVVQTIEQHAIASLNGAIWKLSKASTLENNDLVDRSSLLLTALCGQKHDLLKDLATCYATAPNEGKKVVLLRAKDLAGHIGMSAQSILQLISGSLLPPDSTANESNTASDSVEDLAMEVLKALLQKFGKPSADIVKAATTRYDRCGNVDFIIAVLPGLQKDTLIRHLSEIVNARAGPGNANNEAETKDATNSNSFKDVVVLIMSAQPPALSPAELLVELHKIEPNPAVSNAIRACFEIKTTYKQAAVAQAIQQLIELNVVPDLFMRTVHLARSVHPELESYLTETVMERLIDKKVWLNKLVWEGYLRYCAEIKEKSLKLLLNLPGTQLEEALEKQPILTASFKELVANPRKARRIQAKHRKVISSAIKKASKGKRT